MSILDRKDLRFLEVTKPQQNKTSSNDLKIHMLATNSMAEAHYEVVWFYSLPLSVSRLILCFTRLIL